MSMSRAERDIWNTAIDKAAAECLKTEKRSANSIGARDCIEILNAIRVLMVYPPRFENTYCSQCGKEFGPGDHGYSHCIDHN